MGYFDSPIEPVAGYRHVDVFEGGKKFSIDNIWTSILNKMEFIKRIAFLLLIPVITHGQTAHVDSNRIVYKGTVKPGNVNKEELFTRAENAIRSNVKGDKQVIIGENNEKGMIVTKGSIQLSSPYHLIKTVEYVLELLVEDGNYKYRIDS